MVDSTILIFSYLLAPIFSSFIFYFLWVGNILLMASLTVLLILWSLMDAQIENYKSRSKEDKDSSEQQPVRLHQLNIDRLHRHNLIR